MVTHFISIAKGVSQVCRLPFTVNANLNPVYTQENFPWTDNFSLSCELPCATNGFKTKEIFLSEENFPVCKRALKVANDMIQDKDVLLKC